MLVLRFDTESAYPLRKKPLTDNDWQELIDEMLRAVDALTGVLVRQEVPATFAVVGLLLEKAGPELSALLKRSPLFDVQSHSYTHMAIRRDDVDVTGQLDDELKMTAALIEQYFGHKPIGFVAPGNYHRGIQGQPELLRVFWDNGYRFIGTDGQGEKRLPHPAPLTQPYWYADDGFPELLELPLTGWHCNMLFNSGGQNSDWRPAPGFPDGGILEELPKTPEEGFAVRGREFRHAIDRGLVYSPCMHPWSIYRFDPELRHLEMLIEMAKESRVPVVNALQLYEELRGDAAFS